MEPENINAYNLIIFLQAELLAYYLIVFSPQAELEGLTPMDSTASLDNTPAMTPSKPSQEGATSQGQVQSSCFLVLRGWVVMGE